jgi:hypothetical protein
MAITFNNTPVASTGLTLSFGAGGAIVASRTPGGRQDAVFRAIAAAACYKNPAGALAALDAEQKRPGHALSALQEDGKVLIDETNAFFASVGEAFDNSPSGQLEAAAVPVAQAAGANAALVQAALDLAGNDDAVVLGALLWIAIADPALLRRVAQSGMKANPLIKAADATEVAKNQFDKLVKLLDDRGVIKKDDLK